MEEMHDRNIISLTELMIGDCVRTNPRVEQFKKHRVIELTLAVNELSCGNRDL